MRGGCQRATCTGDGAVHDKAAAEKACERMPRRNSEKAACGGHPDQDAAANDGDTLDGAVFHDANIDSSRIDDERRRAVFTNNPRPECRGRALSVTCACGCSRT